MGAALLTAGIPSAHAAPAAAAPPQQVSFRLTSANLQALDIKGGSTADKATASQEAWSPTSRSQRWTPVETGSGFYQFKNLNSGKCLNFNGASTADNAQAIQYTCNSSDNQLWKLLPTPYAGGYQLVNKNSSKCASVSGGTPGTGRDIVQLPCTKGIPGDTWTPVWEAEPLI